jgi:HAD superfamily hydrolase (TIGR01490 family)
MGNIAFFDFDGTITNRDTLFEFVRFTKGTAACYLGFLRYSPLVVAYKLKLISNQAAKEAVLRHFFRGTPVATLDDACRRFEKVVLPAIIRPQALQEIARLKSEGFAIVIVSASPENWIQGWAAETGAALIGSRLEIVSGKVTGSLVGKNCHGNEKVSRIKEKYRLANYKKIYAYGDTTGDRPMLALATTAFYKPFREGTV